jgi:hypothetical protein
MPASNQLPHNGGADPASPTKNEHTQRQPLSVQARPQQDVALDSARSARSGRILRCSGVSAKSLKQNVAKKISSQFGSVGQNARRVRFSPAIDVLPFCGLIHLTRLIRLSNVHNQ